MKLLLRRRTAVNCNICHICYISDGYTEITHNFIQYSFDKI